MGKVERHSARRGSNVQHGNRPLHFVMAGLVEQIAESDDAGGFAREVYGQSRRTSAEPARDGVEFPAAAAQVVPRYHEIGRAESRAGGKQQTVLTIQESMLDGPFQQCRWSRLHDWRGFER